MTNREAIAAILEREGYPKADGQVKAYSDRPERYAHNLDRRALREGALYQLTGHQLAYKWHNPKAHVDCGTQISADGKLLGQFSGYTAGKPVAIPNAPRPTPDQAPAAAPLVTVTDDPHIERTPQQLEAHRVKVTEWAAEWVELPRHTRKDWELEYKVNPQPLEVAPDPAPLGPKSRRFAALPEAKKAAVSQLFALARQAAEVAAPPPKAAQPAPALLPQDKAARGAVKLAIARLHASSVPSAAELLNLARVYWNVSLSSYRTDAQSKALQAKTQAIYRALEKRADCPAWLKA